MGVVKRENEYLGLKNLDILVEDTQADSKYFRILECPSIITQGKSSFLIGGSPQGYLKAKTEVKFELVHDLTGEVIYTEAVRDHWEGGLRRVSIEVYENVEPGPVTLYVIGELNPETSDVEIPSEWQNIYNVRWQKSLTINSAAVNTQPILFYKQPRITVGETFRGHINVTTGSSYTTYLTGSGEPRQELNPIVPVVNTSAGGLQTPATYPQLDFANKSKLSIIEENKALTKLTGRRGHIGSIGNLLQTNSPASNDYVISLDSTSTVDSLYIGHTITINNPQVDTSKFITESYHSITTPYTSSVMKVLNETTFVPKDVFYVNDTRTTPSTFVPAPLASQYVTASYQDLPVQSISYINYFSFADIQLSDLRTFSGDVHKIKVYVKSDGSLGDFEKIYDSPIESSEVLFDNNESTLLGNMGYFIGSTRLQQYWELYQGKDGNGGSTTITYDSSYIQNAMKVSGDNEEYEDTLRVDLTQNVNFIAGNLYTVRANLYGKKLGKKDSNGNLLNKGEFKVYVKGDAFNKSSIEASHWGSQKFKVPDFPTGVTEYNFGVISGDFIADNTGTGKLQFKVPSGEWYVSDISVKASTDTAFNPDYVRVTAPVPQLRTRPDSLRFLVEFYDVNNNIADSIIFSDAKSFTGENTSIGGTDNILSGSMVIGSALGSGIELAGVGSGFIRSIGYSGFTSASAGTGGPGFMIYSGSVLSHRTDEYNGVGLDLVAHSGSYLRYRTEPIAELDIRADSFFVGNPDSQFISGSGDKIEISSSKFHVQPDGDVIMQGTITADAGNIGDWQIIDGKLSGSNATLDAVGAALYKTDASPESNPHDGYYIDFTPGSNYYIRMGTDFAVSSSGQLFASGAKIEGVLTASEGYIAGWTIAPDSINKFLDSTYTGMSSNGDTRFFAGADSLAASGSAVFNVKATGDITGSSVLFTGGTIGGFDISTTQISSGTDILLDSSNKRLSLADGSVFLDGDLSDGTIYVGRSVTANLSTPSGYGARFKGNGNFILVSGSGQYIRSVGNGLEFASQVVDISGSEVSIRAPQMFFGATGSAYISASMGEMEISSSNFFVKSDGSINAGAGDFTIDTSGNVVMTGTITAEAGTIGGWDLTSSRINSPDSTMRFTSSNPKITIGTHTIGDGPGIQLGYDGSDVLTFFAGQSASDYIKYTAGTGIDIKTAVFNLNTANLDINSAVNSGYISLGSTPNTSIAGTGKGVYMDGTGDFLLYGSATNYFKFDAGATSIDIKTDTFKLDTTNLDIDSSAARITISDGSVDRIHFGEVDGSSTYGMKIFDGTGTADGDILVEVGEGGNTIAGFTIATTGITSTGIGVHPTGQTYAFTAGLSNEFNVKHSGQVTASAALISGSDVDIQVSQFELSTDGVDISSTNQSLIVGSNDLSLSAGTGAFISGSGEFRLGDDDGNISFVDNSFTLAGADVNIRVTQLNISASGFTLSSPQASMSLGNNDEIKFHASGGTNGVPIFKLSGGEISASNFFVDVEGNMTASNAVFSGNITADQGFIGGNTGWTINTGKMTSTGIGVATTAGDSTYAFWAGDDTPASAEYSVTHAGALKSTSGVIGGFAVGTNTLTTTGAGIGDSSQAYGFWAGSDTPASAEYSVTHAGYLKASAGNIGGWEVGTEELTGGQMIIRKDGTIESAGFASNVAGSGFRLTAASGGFLEVENARIRGTLSTAVFEKETVNAVGGQLYVANSTTLTSSIDNPAGFYATGDTTMSVANVTGFIEGEILSAKKVSPTGFGTEYFLIESASRNNSSSDTDYSGKIYVERGYGESWVGDSGSLGESPGGAQTYSGSQVIVSTGKVGTGYIRLNANPNDPYTPYIDIVERTGSNIYDVDLKARLGDLSGLSSARLHGTNPEGQFGLYSKNVYLEGAIVANTGSIAGIEMQSGKLFTGTGTHGNSNTGFYLEDDGKFSLGDKLTWDGSNLSVAGSITITGGSGFATQADVNTAATNAVTSGSNAASTAETNATSAGQASAVATQASASADATTKSNAAQSAAESTAASDATTKSNAAQSAAESTAASDATTKSNAAQSAATAVAVGIGTGAAASASAAETSATAAGAAYAAGAAVSASNAQTTANTGVSNAATAQTQANAGVANAATAQTTANTAETNAQTGITNAATAQTAANAASASAAAGVVSAATAQSNIDSMTTQLVLDSGGMGLWSSGGVASGFLVVDYGTTTTFYDGVDDLAANKKLVLNASGITAYGDNVTTYATFNSSGMTIVDNSVTAGTFTSGTVTLYGASSNDRFVLSSSGMAIYTANVLKATAYDAGFTAYGDNLTTYTTMGSGGLTVVDNDVTTGTFTSGTVTLYGASSNDRVVINNTGMSVYTNNVLKSSALDAGFTAYGDNTTTFTQITSSGITIVDNDITTGTFTSGTVTLYGASSNDRVVINASGMAVYTANVLKASAYDAGFTAYGDNLTTYTSMTSGGITIVDDSVTTGTFTAGTVTLYGASSNDRVVINASGMAVYTANVLKATAYDAGFTAYGDDVNTYAQMSSAGMTIFNDGAVADPNTGVAHYGANMRVGPHHASKSALRVDTSGNLTIGTSGTSNVSMTNAGVVTISGVINASGGNFTGNVTAGSVTIGTGGITGTGYTINASGIQLSGNSTININSVFTVSSAGVLLATSGTVGGFTLGTNTLTSTNVGIGKSGQNQAFWAGSDTQNSAPFRVTHAGALYASNATIQGAITATSGNFVGDVNATHINTTSGSIGGFTIGSNTLTTSGAGIGKTGQNQAFWAGSDTQNSAEFRVSHAGALVASSATISGEINADSGTFTGNVNVDGTLTAGTSKFGENVQSTNDGIWLNANNYWYDTGTMKATTGTVGGFTLGASTLISTNVGIGKSGQNQAFWAGHDTQNSAPFRVTHAGALYANNATIAGEINAGSGTFTGNVTAGSVTIGTGGITGTGYTINASGIQLSGASTIDINSVFTVSSAGVIAATSGTIGGWTLGGSQLYNGRSALATGTGIYLGHDGIVLGGTANPAEIKFLADGSGHLAAGNIVWDTTGNITFGDSTYENVYIANNGVLQFRDGSTVYGELNNTTWTIGNASAAKQVISSTTTTFYDGDGSTARLVISNDGTIELKDSGGVTKVSATTSGVRVTGDNTNDYVDVVSDAINVVAEGATQATFGATTQIGNASNLDYVNIDTAGVKVYGGDADSYTHMDGTSFKVYENAVQKANFASTTWIGDSATTERVQITGTGVDIYDGDNNARITIDSSGNLEAVRLKLETVAEADYFTYRNIVVGGSSGERANYYMQYTSSNADTDIYTALILDASQGGPSGQMIRFNDAPLYPLGVIVAPGYKGGHIVTFEGVETVYIARGHNISGEALRNQARSQGLNPMFSDADPPITSEWGSGGTNYGFSSDGDDIIGGATNGVAGDSFYSHAWTAGDSVAHTNLGKITSGTRLQFTKSSFDFRVTGFNGTPDFAPNFQGGICAPGGVTAGDDAQQNATYKNFTVGSVGATVNVVAYASDERLKENIVPFVSGSDYLDKIRPVEFDWNEKAYEMGFKPDQHHEFGFIAQELGEVLPQSIAPAPINKKDDDYLTIKEEKLIPILVSSLKEQRSEIAVLKEDIKDLKKVIKEL